MDTLSGLGQFLARYPRVNFRRNCLVANVEDIRCYIYFLESGLVKQYWISPSGADFMTHIYHPGAFFPPTILSGPDTSSCYFEAFTPVAVKIIPIEEFLAYLRSDRELLMHFATSLSGYFESLSRRINQLAAGTAYERTAAALVYLGEKIGTTENGSGQIRIGEIITHRELAAWSGTARETTSLNMKMLEKKGLISYHNRRILIHSFDKLLRESGQ